MSYCFPMPTVVVSQILGVDASDYRRFETWIASTVDGQGVDPGSAIDASTEMHEYLTALLARRQQDPRDDLLTFLLTAEVDGQRLSDAERLGIALLLLIAGIDTTANTLAHALLYLSENAEARQRLAGDSLLMTTAVEEFLRIYAPVSLVRGARRTPKSPGAPYLGVLRSSFRSHRPTATSADSAMPKTSCSIASTTRILRSVPASIAASVRMWREWSSESAWRSSWRRFPISASLIARQCVEARTDPRPQPLRAHLWLSD